MNKSPLPESWKLSKMTGIFSVNSSPIQNLQKWFLTFFIVGEQLSASKPQLSPASAICSTTWAETSRDKTPWQATQIRLHPQTPRQGNENPSLRILESHNEGIEIANEFLGSRTTHSRIPAQSSGRKWLGLQMPRHGWCRNSYFERYQKRWTAAAVSWCPDLGNICVECSWPHRKLQSQTGT